MHEGVRYVRVVVRSNDAKQLLSFIRGKRLDLAGRPHRARAKPGAEGPSEVWQAEFFIAEKEAESLAAEGCEFHVDRKFFDRLQLAHKQAAALKPSAEERKELLKTRRVPSADPKDRPPRKGGR